MNIAHLFSDDVNNEGVIYSIRVCTGVELKDPNMADFWVHSEWFAELPVGYSMCERCSDVSGLIMLDDLL